MIFLIYIYIIGIKLIFGNNTPKDIIFKWLDSVNNFSIKYLNWSSTSYFIDYNYNLLSDDKFKEYQDDNKILMLSNHINLCDAFTVLSMLRKRFPEHKIIGVTKKEFSGIPIIGKFLKNTCILLDNGSDENEEVIKTQINKLTQNCKSIVILFPEGKINYNLNIEKSNKWCQKNNMEPFKKVLAPRIKGLQYILKYYHTNVVLLNHLIYLDDLDNKNGKEYGDFIFGKLPKHSIMYIKDVSVLIDHYNISFLKKKDEDRDKYFSAIVNNMWYKMDSFLIKKYNYLDFIYNPNNKINI